MTAGIPPACASAVAAALFTLIGACAHAQVYPAKPIRIIVPFTPGGPNDILSRLISQKLTEAWGQPVLVENRPGGGTVIGTEHAAKAAPDGYTLLIVSPSTATNPSLVRKLPYDTLRDFAPVVLLSTSPNVLAIHPSLPARSVRDLIGLARARPGEVTYGSGGNGTSTHLSGEILALRGGVRMIHVPYKGASPAALAVLTGEVSFTFNSILPMLPHIKSGRLRALAVSSLGRASVLPDVPATAETLPGFEASPFHGIVAPAATPKDIILRLNHEIGRIMNAPDTKDRLAREGTEVRSGTPEQFGAYLRDEIEKWAKVIKAAGIQPQ